MHLALLIFPSLAALLLTAHFFRAEQTLLAGLSAAALVLLAVPRAWAARLLQFALVIGAIEWLRTLAVFVAARMSADQPYLRLMLILGVVAAFTAASGLVFQQARLRQRYRL